jgi:alpha-beta hydrolase superfamily lysophospholipase
MLLLAACTPVVIPAGPVVTMPAVTDAALVMPDGARLPLHRWLPDGPPRAVLLALHGFNDAAGNFMAESVAAFTAAGIAVYAYDQRGFGAAPHPGIWAGAASLAADATEAARLVRARHPGVKLVMLGESMGGAVLVLAATGAAPPPADGYVLMAPAFWGRADMPGPMRWGSSSFLEPRGSSAPRPRRRSSGSFRRTCPGPASSSIPTRPPSGRRSPPPASTPSNSTAKSPRPWALRCATWRRW